MEMGISMVETNIRIYYVLYSVLNLNPDHVHENKQIKRINGSHPINL